MRGRRRGAGHRPFRGAAPSTTATAPGASGLRAVHSCPTWLSLTETWIASQIRSLPPWVQVEVVCDRRVNVAHFTQSGVRAARDRGAAHLLRERVVRRLGMRRHLAILADTLGGPRTILHSHFGDVGWRNAALARSRGVPHVVSFYGRDLSALPRSDRRWRRRYALLFADASLVLCEGPHMASTLRALGCPADRVRVQRLGIDLAEIPFRPRRPPRDEPLRILVAGAFREKKGIPYALRAVAIAMRDGLDARVTLVGGARDAEERAEERRIHAALTDPVLAGRVRVVGFVAHPRLHQLAAQHHVFLSPSVTAANGDTEGGAPVAISEMAASGMPVLSTTHCDIPDVLGAANRRLLVPERDPSALADALRRLTEADWAAIVAANRRHLAHQADARRQGRRLAALYDEVLDVPTRRS